MINIGHFVSWWGTTMAHVAHLANRWDLWDVRSKLVVASKPDIGAIKKASDMGIPVEVVDMKDSATLVKLLSKHNIRVIMNNGLIPKTPDEVVRAFSQDERKWYNQHPGDLRADHLDFGGGGKETGMYGARVASAKAIYLLATRELEEAAFIECSVHTLTEKIDAGELVGMNSLNITTELDWFQKKYWTLKYWEDIQGEAADDLKGLVQWKKDASWKKTQEWIQGKLLPLEHFTVAEVMRVLGSGKIPQRLPIYDYSLWLHPAILDWAKRQAVKLFPKG